MTAGVEIHGKLQKEVEAGLRVKEIGAGMDDLDSQLSNSSVNIFTVDFKAEPEDKYIENAVNSYNRCVRVFRHVKVNYTSPLAWKMNTQNCDQMKSRLLETGKQFSGLANLFDRLFFHLSVAPERWQEFLGILASRDPDAIEDFDELRQALREEQKEVKRLNAVLQERDKTIEELETQLALTKQEVQDALNLNRDFAEMKVKLETEVESLTSQLSSAQQKSESLSLEKMESQKRMVEKWQGDKASASLKEYFTSFVRVIWEDMMRRKLDNAYGDCLVIKDENAKQKAKILDLQKDLVAVQKSDAKNSKGWELLRGRCQKKAIVILTRYQVPHDIPISSKTYLRRAWAIWRFALPHMKNENGRFLLQEARKAFQESAKEIRSLKEMRVQMEKDYQELNKNIFDRGVQSSVTHAVAVIRQRAMLKREFKGIQERMVDAHHKELEAKQSKIMQLEMDIQDNKQLKNATAELDELKWRLHTQPGLPPRQVLALDPSQTCMVCKRQVMYQEFVHGPGTEIETIRDVPGKTYLAHLADRPPKHLFRNIFNKGLDAALLDGMDGGAGERNPLRERDDDESSQGSQAPDMTQTLVAKERVDFVDYELEAEQEKYEVLAQDVNLNMAERGSPLKKLLGISRAGAGKSKKRGTRAGGGSRSLQQARGGTGTASTTSTGGMNLGPGGTRAATPPRQSRNVALGGGLEQPGALLDGSPGLGGRAGRAGLGGASPGGGSPGRIRRDSNAHPVLARIGGQEKMGKYAPDLFVGLGTCAPSTSGLLYAEAPEGEVANKRGGGPSTAPTNGANRSDPTQHALQPNYVPFRPDSGVSVPASSARTSNSPDRGSRSPDRGSKGQRSRSPDHRSRGGVHPAPPIFLPGRGLMRGVGFGEGGQLLNAFTSPRSRNENLHRRRSTGDSDFMLPSLNAPGMKVRSRSASPIGYSPADDQLAEFGGTQSSWMSAVSQGGHSSFHNNHGSESAFRTTGGSSIFRTSPRGGVKRRSHPGTNSNTTTSDLFNQMRATHTSFGNSGGNSKASTRTGFFGTTAGSSDFARRSGGFFNAKDKTGGVQLTKFTGGAGPGQAGASPIKQMSKTFSGGFQWR
ncbi:unnamed protein product [Amoebophrya sp. A25]|nr:unnamed protein product [Amoebophrya sp. A25]|eukprot:GSA25T00001550001.1